MEMTVVIMVRNDDTDKLWGNEMRTGTLLGGGELKGWPFCKMWSGWHAHIDDSQNGCFHLPKMEHCWTGELHSDGQKTFYTQIMRKVLIGHNIMWWGIFRLCSSVALSILFMKWWEWNEIIKKKSPLRDETPAMRDSRHRWRLTKGDHVWWCRWEKGAT